MDNLQGYRPWARWLMQTRCWWLVLVMHALCSPLVLLLLGIAEMLREGWADYVRLFDDVRRTRAAILRNRKAQHKFGNKPRRARRR